MANIEVTVEGNVNPFKQAMKQASAASREFAEEAVEHVGKVGNGLKAVAGETGFGSLLKLVGAAGLGGAAIQFGINLVNGVKAAISAAGEMEKVMARASTAFGEGAAFEIKEWAERTAGGMDPKELISAATKIKNSGDGLTPEKAITVTDQLRGAAAFTGESLEDLSDMYAKGQSHDFTNLGRLFRSQPALRTIFKQDLPEFSDIDKAATKGEITPEIFDRVLAKESAPGGRFANARFNMSQTLGAKEAKANVQAEKLQEAFGEGTMVGLKKVLDDLTTNLPVLTGQAKALGEMFGKIIANAEGASRIIMGNNPNQNPVQRLDEVNDNMIKGFNDWLGGIWHNITTGTAGSNGAAPGSNEQMAAAMGRTADHLEDVAQGAAKAFNPRE